MTDNRLYEHRLPALFQFVIVLIALVLLCGGLLLSSTLTTKRAYDGGATDFSGRSRSEREIFRLTEAQRASLALTLGSVQAFTPALVTEGKIAIDENGRPQCFRRIPAAYCNLWRSPETGSRRANRSSWSRQPIWCSHRTTS